MTEGEAAPAAAAEQGSRNLLMRVVAALVLAPAAIAIAYAGGWLWTALVTLAAIGLYVEWLMIVGAARETRVVASGVVALAMAGLCLALGPDRCCARACWRSALPRVALLSPERRGWAAAGFVYAAAAEIASVLVRLDQAWGFAALILVLLVVWVTDIGGYFAGRGIGGPKLWPRVSPKKTWAGADRRLCREPCRRGGICGVRSRQNRPVAAARRGAFDRLAARRSLRIRGEAALRRQGFQPHHSRAMAGCWTVSTASSPRSCWRRFSGFCGAAWMASAAVLWFGEDMSAVPLRNNKAAASAVRTVTVLGATGSIGDSTMDLLRASRDRYRVEALTAQYQRRRGWRSWRGNSARDLRRSPIPRGSPN